ncbi:MAG: hypothetical protein LBE08_12575 [Bifidobacteriaceae bacterium]|nr:hypothetical protein [Bifidobacteriaceae bacterium]
MFGGVVGWFRVGVGGEPEVVVGAVSDAAGEGGVFPAESPGRVVVELVGSDGVGEQFAAFGGPVRVVDGEAEPVGGLGRPAPFTFALGLAAR